MKMSIFSKPFGGLVTAWKSNEFFLAKIKLTLLYIVVIAVILAVFDGVLMYRLNDNFSQLGVKISSDDAEQIALSYKPAGKIVEIEEETINGKSYYEIHFSDHTEIAVDAFSGTSSLETDLLIEHEGTFRDYLEDALLFVNILVLLLAGSVSYFFAGKNLEPIAKKMQQQKQFTADAAHELRNPLAAMRAAAESVLRKKVISAKESREVLEGILEDSERLSSLTEGLLKLVASETAVEKFQMINVTTIVKRVVKKLTPLAKQQGIVFKGNVKKFSRMGDAEMMETLVFNLVHNAVKFSHRKGEVIVSLNENGELTVQDFGIGIAPQHISYIFDRFYKAEKSRQFDLGGSGLGLSIVNEIAKLHDANVIVSSNLGKGTLFKILF